MFVKWDPGPDLIHFPDPSPPPKKSKETKELIRWFFGDCPSKKLNDNNACGGCGGGGGDYSVRRTATLLFGVEWTVFMETHSGNCHTPSPLPPPPWRRKPARSPGGQHARGGDTLVYIRESDHWTSVSNSRGNMKVGK